MNSNYRATISYLGTHFCGWQDQGKKSRRPSVQGTMQEVLTRLSGGDHINVQGSGRTDSGVHASGQVVHFKIPGKPWEAHKLLSGLNALLPPAIRVLELVPADPSFHSQKGVLKKQYSYWIQLGPAAVPQLLPYSLWRSRSINPQIILEEMRTVLGKHDFSAFAAADRTTKTSVRSILDVDLINMTENYVLPPGYELIKLVWVGSGFLKQMIRSLVGTLLEIESGRKPRGHLSKLLLSKDRTQVGKTAPAHGLWLDKVWYHGDSHRDECGLSS